MYDLWFDCPFQQYFSHTGKEDNGWLYAMEPGLLLDSNMDRWLILGKPEFLKKNEEQKQKNLAISSIISRVGI